MSSSLTLDGYEPAVAGCALVQAGAVVGAGVVNVVAGRAAAELDKGGAALCERGEDLCRARWSHAPALAGGLLELGASSRLGEGELALSGGLVMRGLPHASVLLVGDGGLHRRAQGVV